MSLSSRCGILTLAHRIPLCLVSCSFFLGPTWTLIVPVLDVLSHRCSVSMDSTPVPPRVIEFWRDSRCDHLYTIPSRRVWSIETVNTSLQMSQVEGLGVGFLFSSWLSHTVKELCEFAVSQSQCQENCEISAHFYCNSYPRHDFMQWDVSSLDFVSSYLFCSLSINMSKG